MAWPSAPRTYHCPSCGFTKTLIPQSDCLVPGRDILQACPRCGHTALDAREPTAFELAAAKLEQAFRPKNPMTGGY